MLLVALYTLSVLAMHTLPSTLAPSLHVVSSSTLFLLSCFCRVHCLYVLLEISSHNQPPPRSYHTVGVKATRPPNVMEHYPSLPDPHTFQRTLVSGERGGEE